MGCSLVAADATRVTPCFVSEGMATAERAVAKWNVGFIGGHAPNAGGIPSLRFQVQVQARKVS